MVVFPSFETGQIEKKPLDDTCFSGAGTDCVLCPKGCNFSCGGKHKGCIKSGNESVG